MKGISVKKIAAIAAGAALVGTALAPFAGALSKSDVFNDNGTPKAKVVVGSIAAVSDAVWAGNIAAKIASMAYTESDVSCSAGSGEATCSLSDASATVDLTVGGTTTVSTEQQKVYKKLLNSSAAELSSSEKELTITSLPFLKDETVTIKVDNNQSSINEKESIYVNVDALSRVSTAPRDLMALINSSGDFYYKVTLNGTTGINLGTTSFTDGTDDSIPIYLFGEKYFLQSATLSGTPELRLVKGSQKDKYFSNDLIEGLKGDGEYEGKTVAIKISSIVASGPAAASYSATFQLLVDGEVKYSTEALSQGEDLKDNIFDSQDQYALKDSVYLDSIGVDAETGKGYVSVTVGSNTIRLVNDREYPYDSTGTSTDPDYWRVSISYSGNYLKSITIKNQDVKWDYDNAYGPLYPTTSGQSLTGHTGTIASFGHMLDDGTLGKGFAKVEFKGFDYSGKTMTSVEIGKAVTDDLASGADHGGLKYIGVDNTVRYVPFYYRVDDSGSNNSDSNTTFTVYSGTTEKVIYQTLNKGTYKDASTAAGRNDYNLQVYSLDYINGRLWTIASTADDGYTQINVAGVGDFNKTVGNSFTVDGTTFTVCDSVVGDDGIHVYVDGYIALAQNNYFGNNGTKVIHATDTNHAGKLYFTEGSVFDSNSYTGGSAGTGQENSAQIDLDVDSTRSVFYAVKVTANKVYYLLDAQTFTKADTTNNVIQSNKVLEFLGTAVPADDGTYTEDATLDYGYYSPKENDYNIAAANTTAAGVYTSSKAYHIAKFRFNDALQNVDTTVFIDTADGGLAGPHGGTAGETSPSYPTFDANFVGGSPSSVVLTTGTQSGYYTAAYLDTGTKIWLDETRDSFRATSPDTNAYIQIVVYGDKIIETTEGGETKTGLAEGDVWTTDTGTEIKVTKVSVTGTCSATGGSASCSPNVSKAVVPASVGNLVYLDSEAPAAGPYIIVGGPLVNTLAKAYEDEIALDADGKMYYDTVSSGDIVVAGFSAEDTVSAAKAFIAALSNLE